MVYTKTGGDVVTMPGNPLTGFLNFFIPQLCQNCNNKLQTDEKVLCKECLHSILPADDFRLIAEYNKKFFQKGFISGFYSPFLFEKEGVLQNVLHNLKYKKRFQNGIYLGELLGIFFRKNRPEWKLDLIIPIPLHRLKKAERGYNQSFYISKGIKRVLRIPVNVNALKRIRYTETQTTMSKTERENNIADAFKVVKIKDIEGKRILLVDDVITTGATVNECGKALINSGVAKVYAASISLAD